MFGKLFLHKSLRFYLELCAGVIGIAAAILFYLLDRKVMGGNLGFSDISHFTLIFILAGSLLAIVDAFFPLPGLGIAATAVIGCGVGNHLRLACYPMADAVLGVAFFTKDVQKAQAAVTLFSTFLAIFLLIAIALIVGNFLDKEGKKD